jgi:hypothetical protein
MRSVGSENFFSNLNFTFCKQIKTRVLQLSQRKVEEEEGKEFSRVHFEVDPSSPR